MYLCFECFRIGMAKKYIAGTGNSHENKGHDVVMQMEYQSNQKCFIGKWYVNTSSYEGSGKCWIKKC